MKRKFVLIALFLSLLASPVEAMSPLAYQYLLSANYYLTVRQPDKAIEELKKQLLFLQMMQCCI